MSSLKSGDYVRHTSCPEWGYGVVADLRGSMAVVLFENSNRPREFRVPSPFLKAAPEAASDPPKVNHLRSALRAAGNKRKSAAIPKIVRPFEEVVLNFRATHPEGFGSEHWAACRELRANAEKHLREIAGPERWRALVADGKFEDLAKAHREFVQKSGLMHPVQAARISNIKDGAFWFAYGEWIWVDGPCEALWDEVVKGLAAVEQATWPNMTAIRGVLYPKTDIFIKPDSVKRTAAAMKQQLQYDSKPTFAGYQQIIEFTKRVRDRLDREGLNPTDLWDVSQFFQLLAGKPVVSLAPPRKSRSKPKKSKKAPAAGQTQDSGGNGQASAANV